MTENTIRDAGTGLFVSGEWRPAPDRSVIEVENPATEAVFGFVPLCGPDEVTVAVAAARDAAPGLAAMPIEARLDLLRGIDAALEARAEALAQAVTAELGCPITLSRVAQVPAGRGHLRGVIEALEGFAFERSLPSGDTVRHEPAGIVAAITPWNWPINQIALKVFPALAAGCPVVLKPSELTPFSAMLMIEAMAEAGIPAGAVNLITGDGPTTGAALVAHLDVDLISFTGSTRAGCEVMRAAATGMRRVTLELGGKSPNVIFGDIDVEFAAAAGARHCFQNTGQSCNAPTRMPVEAFVYDRAVAAAAEAAGAQGIGDPSEEGAHISPLASRAQAERVKAAIVHALAEGARLVAGGPGRPQHLTRGHYARPTVLADVTPDMTVFDEEVFGPVLTITPFTDEAEAVRLANATPYGLAAYVRTGDAARGERVARAIRAGMVHLNGSDIAWGSPFGGRGASGIGREGGPFGIEDMTEIKAISRPMGGIS